MVKIDGNTGVDTIQNGMVMSNDLATSIALTGTPTAPTATPGTSTTQLATTAFVTALVSGDVSLLSANGYQKLPSGLIIQWATWVDTGLWTTFNFPIAFPNACLSFSHSMGKIGSEVISSSVTTVSSLTATSYRVGTSGGNGWTIRMIAIGY
jgi:hypothetical protein